MMVEEAFEIMERTMLGSVVVEHEGGSAAAKAESR